MFWTNLHCNGKSVNVPWQSKLDLSPRKVFQLTFEPGCRVLVFRNWIHSVSSDNVLNFHSDHFSGCFYVQNSSCRRNKDTFYYVCSKIDIDLSQFDQIFTWVDVC